MHLNTADAVLEERYAGKRIDPLTGGKLSPALPPHTLTPSHPHPSPPDVYHTVFDPPKSSEVAARLVTEPGGPEENLTSTLLQYHRHAPSLLSCYQRTTKSINADQPIGDVFAEGMLLCHASVTSNYACTLSWPGYVISSSWHASSAKLFVSLWPLYCIIESLDEITSS